MNFTTCSKYRNKFICICVHTVCVYVHCIQYIAYTNSVSANLVGCFLMLMDIWLIQIKEVIKSSWLSIRFLLTPAQPWSRGVLKYISAGYYSESSLSIWGRLSYSLPKMSLLLYTVRLGGCYKNSALFLFVGDCKMIKPNIYLWSSNVRNNWILHFCF